MDRCIEDSDLLFNGNGAVAVLLQHLNDALALRQTRLGICVQIGAELGKALQLTILRVDQLERTGDLLHRLDLALPPTRETEIPGLTAGRMPAWNSSVSRKICRP